MSRVPFVLFSALVAMALGAACEEKIPPILALENGDAAPVVVGLEDASDAPDAGAVDAASETGPDSD